MFPVLKEMPKCQDGRVCKGKNNGFIVATFEKGMKFVCGDCYQAARKELLMILASYKLDRKKELEKDK